MRNSAEPGGPRHMLPTRFWAELTWRDFQAPEIEDAIAILPVAADRTARAASAGRRRSSAHAGLYRARCRAAAGAICRCSSCRSRPSASRRSTQNYPGTLSLSPASLIAVLSEIGASVARAGVRKLVLLNSHGGNVALLDMVAQDLRARHRLLAVKATWHRFGYPDGLFSEEELKHGIHAGDIETSLMLSFRPDLVRDNERENFDSAAAAIESDFTWLRTGRPTGFGWMTQDLSPPGRWAMRLPRRRKRAKPRPITVSPPSSNFCRISRPSTSPG